MRAPLGIPTRYFGAGSPFQWFPDTGRGRQPFSSFPAGARGIAAGPNGIAIGQFGWVDPDLQTINWQKVDGWQMLAFVLPTYNGWNWQRVYPQPPVGCSSTPPKYSGVTPAPATPSAPFVLYMIRAGMQVVPAVSGDFLTRFPLGGQAGSQVWADPSSGLPYDSDLGGYVATPWTLTQSGAPGAALRISSFSAPVN